MTKEAFIQEAEKLGFESYKDLVEKLGYSKRYLDRITYDKDVNESFLEQFEKYKATLKETPKPQQEVETVKEPQKVEPKQETKKVVEKKEIKKKSENKPKNKDEIGIDIPNEEYHSSAKLGSSKIKLILENAREYQARYITKEVEQKKTDALLIGSMHHTLVMEAHKFNDDYIVLNMPSRPVKQDYIEAVEMLGGELETRENSKKEIVVADTVDTLKEKLEELKKGTDKTIVTQAQLDIAMTTSEKALESMFVVEASGQTLLKAKLREVLELDDCHVERTFYGTIEGVEIQVRPDALVNLSKENKIWFVIDLKTALDATMSMFARQSASFFYDIQEWVYREILRQNGIDVKDFRFNIAGKSEASRSAYYQLHHEDIENAEKIVRKVLKKYKWCKENDIWEEGFFDYHEMRFVPTAVVQMPTYRHFEMVKMGIL